MTKRAPATRGAIVLGGSNRALAVTRSLSRHGVRVWVARTDDTRLAVLSRHASRRLDWSGHTPQKSVAALLELARKGARGWVVMPCDDDDARMLAEHHSALSDDFVLAADPWPRMQWALDKRSTYAFAAQVGLAHPRTWHPGSDDGLRRLDVPFPVIVKPAGHSREMVLEAPKAWRADDRTELEAAWTQARRFLPPERLMIKDFIPGGGNGQLAYAALCRDGEVLASLAARRLRQRPMDFGKASTFVETIDDAEVAGPAQRLLREAAYTGMVEVEFKRSDSGGPPLLLDVNPRAWGWISIGARAGVDFPWLPWRMLTGENIERIRARPGVRWVRGITDLPTAASEIAAGRLGLGSWLRSVRPPLALATLSAEDPLPGLAEPAMVAWRALGRSRGRRAA